MSQPHDHDRYLAKFPEPQRAVLQALRETIRAAVPEATETISYGVPTFKVGKRNLVHYAGFKDHCSFFPGSAATTDSFKDELGAYRTGRGTIQFPVEAPLSADLVTRVVKARLAEEAARHRK
jgi:uncharacterized protein YdhG (YjbR/CyaY superfamily)